MAEMSDFQKQFLAKGIGNELFTQKEFDDELAKAKAELVVTAIETTKRAIVIEREACAKIVKEWDKEKIDLNEIALAILNRIPSQRQ